MDKNWLRWMRASIVDYFVGYIQRENQLHVFIDTTEHVDEAGNYVTKLPTWAEARFNGPFVVPITKNSFRAEVFVNFLISTKLDRTNAYDHDDNVGIVFASFINSINVFKLASDGTGATEPLGCFQLQTDHKNAIMVNHFGQLDTDVKLTQSTVEAHYVMHLDL